RPPRVAELLAIMSPAGIQVGAHFAGNGLDMVRDLRLGGDPAAKRGQKTLFALLTRAAAAHLFHEWVGTDMAYEALDVQALAMEEAPNLLARPLRQRREMPAGKRIERRQSLRQQPLARLGPQLLPPKQQIPRRRPDRQRRPAGAGHELATVHRFGPFVRKAWSPSCNSS